MYTMVHDTIIRIRSDLKKQLHKLKIHPRETYGDVVERILKSSK